MPEDDLRWKTTFGGRHPLVEDDLWWKMTCGGRRPSVEDDLHWILVCCLLRFVDFFLLYHKPFKMHGDYVENPVCWGDCGDYLLCGDCVENPVCGDCDGYLLSDDCV